MSETEHNIVGILYSLKGMIESHVACLEEGRFEREKDELAHANRTLRKAYSQASAALEITRRLTGLLRSSKDKPARSGKASLRKAWRHVVKSLRREFPFDAVRLVERIGKNFPYIRCDTHDLNEILCILSRNALQAMPQGGRLAIRAQLGFSAREELYAVITIADTGPGIPEEMLPGLFEPFFSTKSEPGGTGLGLYIARALVSRNVGRITASSFSGLGTSFTMEFSVFSRRLARPASRRFDLTRPI